MGVRKRGKDKKLEGVRKKGIRQKRLSEIIKKKPAKQIQDKITD